MMGKIALAKWREAKARSRRTVLAPRQYRRRGAPPVRRLQLLTGRQRTRVIAALLHDVDHATIARDQKITRRVVYSVAIEEGLLRWAPLC